MEIPVDLHPKEIGADSSRHEIGTSMTSTFETTTDTSAVTTTPTNANKARSQNDQNDSSPTLPPPLKIPTFLDRRIIDSKNTLQSFVAIDNVVGNTAQPTAIATGGAGAHRMSDHDNAPPFKPPPGILFDGRPIDPKNTAGSFVVPTLVKAPPAIANTVSTTRTASAVAIALTEQAQLNSTAADDAMNTGDAPNLETGETIHAEAVDVVYVAVHAERTASQAEHWYRSKQLKLCRLVIVVVIGLLAVLAVGIGTYCGTGNCGNSDTPSVAPIITPATLSPISMHDQSLATACNFLNSANVSECQTITLFSTTSTGGTIPTEIGLLTQITSLELDDTGLTGSIPSALEDLTQLQHLLLNVNQLTSSIPSALGNLTHLVELRLNENQLNGTIPSTLGNLKQLTLLRVHVNQLGGTIPSTLGHLNQLTSLSLRDNQLNGTIPSSLGELTRLTGLWLFNNTQLKGTIPSALCSVPNIDIRIDCANIVCACCFDANHSHSCSSDTSTTTTRSSSIDVPTTTTTINPTTSSPTIKLPMPTIIH